MKKAILQLKFGYNDASQYAHGKDKDFFNRFFLKTEHLEQIQDTKKYFILGEKGSGKTAYAVFASNGNIPGTNGRILTISNTEYKKFIELKKREQLAYSDYTAIWRVLLLVLMSQHIREEMPLWDKAKNYSAYRALNKAIDTFFSGAFTPELSYAFEIIREGKTAAAFKTKLVEVSDHQGESERISSQSLNLSLLGIERDLKNAIEEITTKSNHVIFIDGIDQRPPDINYQDYKACIDGLIEAVWSLNSGFFSESKRIRSRMRIVLLCRPDLLYSSGIHNAGGKILDNGVSLNWVTNNAQAKNSPLYSLTNHILGCEQKTEAKDWIETYWPDTAADTVFRELLRLTWHRPRDFITLFRILVENRSQRVTQGDEYGFTLNEIKNATLRRKFSDYMLSEIKDYSLFYMGSDKFDHFLSFFQGLHGNGSFTWSDYLTAYSRFMKKMKPRLANIPQISNGAEVFIQFLYEMNVVAYKETSEDNGELFVHWAFRERTPAELRPRIKIGVSYEIHPGIAKALNIGKKMI